MFKKLFCLFFLTSLLMANEFTQEVDRVFARYKNKNTPGCILGIIHNGKFLYKRGYGMANIVLKKPITSQTVFRIASTSKQFTAACIGLLILDKKISLNDNIRKYIPELPRYKYRINISHLIYHSSGLSDYLDEDISELELTKDTHQKDVVRYIAKAPEMRKLLFRPGLKHSYSNTGYILMAEIVARASKMSLRNFAQKKIFTPLKMKNTLFFDDNNIKVKNRALGYSIDQGEYYIDMAKAPIVGDGGILTTVEDLFLWDQNFYHNKLGGGKKFIKMLLKPGKTKLQKVHYGFGLETEWWDDVLAVHHSGSFAGFQAQMVRIVKHKLTVICLCNLSTMDPTSLIENVINVYFDYH